MTCEREWDVEADQARARAHIRQLHFPFVNRCPENEPECPGFFAELYDTPWQEQPRDAWFCSDECEEAYCRSGSFDYVWCEGCKRQICYQNPRNGWHVQFREHEDLGGVCLHCYEEEILSNGQPGSDFEGSAIRGGMFFSRENLEPKADGFLDVDGFRNYFIAGSVAADRYNAHALSLIDSGNKVITAYERLAIGGLEGYITMMAKANRKSDE